MSALISTEELVGLLNAVFCRFDALAERHRVEKIKSIGDAYMVVAGVPDSCPDHAERIGTLALDFLQADSNSEHGLSLNIGIGIHGGQHCRGQHQQPPAVPPHGARGPAIPG